MDRMLKAYACFITILLIFSFSCISYANNGGVVVSQTRINFQADRDSGLIVPVRLENTSDEEMVVSVRKADFEIDSKGVFQIKDSGTSANSAGDYIVCDESEFRMPGNTDKTIEVSLAENKTYALPEYNSTILVKYAPVSMVQSQAQVKTYIQTAIIVTVNPGGLAKVNLDISVPPISLSGIGFNRIMGSGKEKTFSVNFKNSGVVTVSPNLHTTINSLFSGETINIPYGITGILPGKNKEYSFKFKPSGWFDIYTVKLNYEYEYGGKSFSDFKTITFTAVSYPVLIGVLLVVTGIIIQIVINKKRNRLLKQLLSEKEGNKGKTGDIPTGSESTGGDSNEDV